MVQLEIEEVTAVKTDVFGCRASRQLACRVEAPRLFGLSFDRSMGSPRQALRTLPKEKKPFKMRT